MKCYILNSFGGIWIDSDIKFNKPFEFRDEFYIKDFNYICGCEANSVLFRNVCTVMDRTDFIAHDQSVKYHTDKIINKNINTCYATDLYNNKQLQSCISRNFRNIDSRQLSFIIPVRNDGDNAVRYVNELLDIIDENLWYDIILIDLCSTDATYEKMLTIHDNRVVIFQERYNSKGDAINYAINRSTSDKFLIIDNINEKPARDMLHVISSESLFMQSDVIVFNHPLTATNIGLDYMLSRSATYDYILVSSAIKDKLHYYYEPYYVNIENFKFCMHCILEGLKVSVSSEQTVYDSRMLNVVDDSVRNRFNRVFNDNGEHSEMTAVLPFINEGDEVERTVQSLKYKAFSIRVLLIDDCSNDGFDYRKIADRYRCEYIRNDKRLGSAGGKNLGGNSVCTKYFCFFDAHMRIYKDNWDLIGIQMLKRHPKSIISSRTTYMTIEDNMVQNEAGIINGGYTGTSACCKIIMDNGFAFEPKWTDKFIDDDITHIMSPVSCVLGAAYLISKEWWEYIRGFDGLYIYGLEEPYMSVKTWLLGGQCFVVKDWGVGHIYRNQNPAPVTVNDIEANRIFLINVFLEPDERDMYLMQLRNRIGEATYNDVIQIYNDNINANVADIKKYIDDNKVNDIRWFFSNINEKVL